MLSSNRQSTLLLSLNFGRKKRPVIRKGPPMPIILPGVMEITAQPDAEAEERERLRAEAAEAIGLTPDLLGASASSDDDNDNNPEPDTPSTPQLPSFPCTLSALSLQVASSTVLKYYPTSSLRIFALSKHWKSRFMVLSSSYLHLFKTAAEHEEELERLEINEDSVVFVAEEDVAGKRHVIKVGGIDVGALRKEFTQEENGRTMWFLQIADQAEAQRWITTIKNVIFGQKNTAGWARHSFTYAQQYRASRRHGHHDLYSGTGISGQVLGFLPSFGQIFKDNSKISNYDDQRSV